MRVAVVGLGYVGLPLAIALARHFDTIGLDSDVRRVAELRDGHDRTREIPKTILAASALRLTTEAVDCADADLIVVTVPTPIDAQRCPDLRPLIAATRTIGDLLRPGRGTIVIYESTVYPGVTEDICGPLLANVSGLQCGSDFFLGYSPERINPGDRNHTVDRIVKVIAGQTPEVTERMAEMYSAVTSAGVFRAASIKVAEAAKVIENAQRDINIAFMNEITQIFARLDLSIWDVLATAGTKWNFLPFQPGLVGGHCIGVDPFYLSHRAQELGHQPQVILAGRAINDGMAEWVLEEIQRRRGGAVGKALVMGLTFKEDVPDLRNSKAVDLAVGLDQRGYEVTAHDPLADSAEVSDELGLRLEQDLKSGDGHDYDLILVAVAHAGYRSLPPERLLAMLRPGGMIVDLKGIWRRDPPAGVEYWTL